MIAALYVANDGPYMNREDVDPWTLKRDARSYRGPHRVIAHPPCKRWGRYWGGGPSRTDNPMLMGDDDNCFASALWAVRQWGGILEHPEGSHAFRWFGLPQPYMTDGHHVVVKDPQEWPAGKAWSMGVDQGHYGHRARKRTWLYGCGIPAPWLDRTQFTGGSRLDNGYHSAQERAQAKVDGTYMPVADRLSARENLLTPPKFAEVLLAAVLDYSCVTN